MVLTFDKLMAGTEFVKDMRGILHELEKAYDYPVDIEFAVNFLGDGAYRINLLQCRPLQARGGESARMPAVEAAPEDLLIQARGAVIGQSRVVGIDCFIYVVPSVYAALPERARYEVARAIGDANRALGAEGNGQIMLLGPGRWGTSSPALGIPVSFSDINNATVICEIVMMREDLVPDVSLGTHFLNELVEMEMLYLALFPAQGDNRMNAAFFESAPNRLGELAPEAAKWEHVVRVVRARDAAPDGARIVLVADAIEQKVMCFVDRDSNPL